MRRAALFLAMLLVAAPAQAAAPIAGHWLVADGSGVVEIARCGAATCGRLVRIVKAAPGAPKTDVNNRDPALRRRPILGLPILTGFTDAGADWRGTIYDPRNGKSYRSILFRNEDGSLAVKGCIAVFCQTQRWTMVD